jgi:hypothetical protein
LAPNLYPAGISGNPTGDILQGKEAPYSYDPFAVGVSAGYRVLPELSTGLMFSYASFQATDGTDTGDYVDGTNLLRRQMWSLGVYGRYYLTTWTPRLHPWVELGVGYFDDKAQYVRGGSMTINANVETEEFYLEDKGFVVPITLGLDWRLAPAFAVGPMLGYERAFPTEGCVNTVVDMNSPYPGMNTCDSRTVQANGFGVFFGGIFAKVTIGPVIP